MIHKLLVSVFVLYFALTPFALAKKGGEPVPDSAGGFDQEHTKWNQILKEFQASDGNIRYKQLKKASKGKKSHPFNQYLDSLETVSKDDFMKWSRNNQMAFLINAYNAFTVKLIVDKYPVKSIKRTFRRGKPWSKKLFKLFGEA